MMNQKPKFDDVLQELEFQKEELWRSQQKKTVKERDASREEYRRKYREITDKKDTIKSLRGEEMIGTSFMIGFHDAMNTLGTSFYRMLRPPKIEVAPEEARQNMHGFLLEKLPPRQPVEEKVSTLNKSKSKRKKKKEKPVSLEDKIQKYGEHYIPYEDIVKIDQDVLWRVARQYDWKGIIPNPKETLPELVYRGNSLLYLGQRHRELWGNTRGLDIKIERETWMVQPQRGYDYEGKVSVKDIQKALERVPYYMDLSWFPTYVKKEFIVPALGVTFTLPHYNGLGFIQVLPSYKSRDKFLEILSHELVHAGTVYLDSSRDYLETKAYHVGKGSLIGEYAVAVNQRPHLIMRGIEFAWNFFLPWLPLPERAIKYFPKAKAALQIVATTGTFRDVEQKLTELYGKKGNYILGRLTGDEIEEFHFTNDIPARMAMKDTLKWKIMKTNFETLE